MGPFYFILSTFSLLSVTKAQAVQCPDMFSCLNFVQSQPTNDTCNQFVQPLTCIGGLKGTCDVNETVVTFSTVAQLSQEACQASNGKYDLTCPYFMACNQNSELLQLMASVRDDPTAAFGKLLDASLWCRHTEHVTGCLLGGSSRCSLEADALSRLKVLYPTLSHACHGGAGGQTIGGCDTQCQAACGEKLVECQVAAERGGGHGRSCADLATAQNPCTIFQGQQTCFANNLNDKCLAIPGIRIVVQNIGNQTKESCIPTSACSWELSKCMCNLDPEFSRVCEGLPKAQACLRIMPEMCTIHPNISQIVDLYELSNDILTYMACDKNGGVCPETFKCVEALGRNNGGPHSRTGGSEDYNICSMNSYFDCLDRATYTCKIDQGTATFPQIKEVVGDLCREVIPHSAELLGCPQYQKCINETFNLNRFKFFFSNDVTADQRWSYAHLAVSTTRTGYWCSSLGNGYACALDNAEVCGVPANKTTIARQQYERLQSMCVGAATVGPLHANSGAETVWNLQEKLSLMVTTTVLLFMRNFATH